jgi:hypothetical protein
LRLAFVSARVLAVTVDVPHCQDLVVESMGIPCFEGEVGEAG